MKKFLFSIVLLAGGSALWAQTPQDFVGNWKSDPGTPTMTRKLEFDGHVILMTELQPGRNGTNGRKFHDVWTISPDKRHYTNEMVIAGGGPGRGGEKGGDGNAKGGGNRTVKFSFTKED